MAAPAGERMEEVFDVLYGEGMLGRGQYGRVFKARNRQDGHEVAVKELAKADNSDPAHAGIPSTAMREVTILKCLKAEGGHPNIIEFHGVHVTNSTVHIWTELCQGTVYHLQRALQKATQAEAGAADIVVGGPIPREVVRWWTHSTLSALQKIHGLGLIHRDLKPENLFLSATGVLKVADFGLARQVASSSQQTEQIVTEWYRPPDVILGNRSYEFDIDVWPLGCILVEMLIGTPLFCGVGPLQQLQLIFDCLPIPAVAKTYPKWSTMHVDLPVDSPTRTTIRKICASKGESDEDTLDIIEKMLQCDPSSRISVDEALAHPYFGPLDAEETVRDKHVQALVAILAQYETSRRSRERSA